MPQRTKVYAVAAVEAVFSFECTIILYQFTFSLCFCKYREWHCTSQCCIYAEGNKKHQNDNFGGMYF